MFVIRNEIRNEIEPLARIGETVDNFGTVPGFDSRRPLGNQGRGTLGPLA